MPISPNQGSIAGGNQVTITGVNLANAVAVLFGSSQATIVTNTPNSITVVSPSGNGVADVVVITGGGQSNPLSFYYILSPIFESLSNDSGSIAGGETVTLFGRNLSTATSVAFGSNSATPAVINDGQLSVVVPAGTSTGSVNVSVTTGGGTDYGPTYVYVDAPTITNISPSSGSTLGGDTVTINGTGYQKTMSVTFDGINSPFGVVNSTTITAISPPGTAGAVDVVVTTTGGSATAVDAYTYVAGPGI